MKKIISLLLILTMLLTTMNVFAVDDGTTTYDSGEVISVQLGTDNEAGVTNGDYVIVPVKLSGFPEQAIDQAHSVAAATFTIIYDSAKLTFNSIGKKVNVFTPAASEFDEPSYSQAPWITPTPVDVEGTLKLINVPFTCTDDARMTSETFAEASSELFQIRFKLADNAKGKTTITCENALLRTNNSGDDIRWTEGYFRYTPCEVTISDTYAVTKAADAEAHGTVAIAVEGDKNYEELDGAENVTVTVEPKDGYELDTLSYATYTYDGDTKEYDKEDGAVKYTTITSGTPFEMPTKNVEIKATYRALTYAVTAERIVATDSETSAETESGVTFTISPADAEIAFDKEVTVTPNLDDGVALTTLTATSDGKDADGEPFGTVNLLENNYKFTMPSGPVTISGTATYTADSFTVKLSDDSSDSSMYDITGNTSYKDGKEVVITVTPKEGYNVVVTDVTGNDTTPANTVVTSPYTFIMPRLEEGASYLIKVVAEVKTYDSTDNATFPIKLATKSGETFDYENTGNVGGIIFYDSLGNETTSIKPFSSYQVEIEPVEGYSIISATAYNSEGIAYDENVWKKSATSGYSQTYDLTVPASADVVIVSETASEDKKITGVTVSYAAKVKPEGAAEATTTTIEDEAADSVTATELDEFATDINEIKVTSNGVNAEVFTDVDATQPYDPDVETKIGAGSAKTFYIKVTAADGTTHVSSFKITNTNDPDGGGMLTLTPDVADVGGYYYGTLAIEGASEVDSYTVELEIPTEYVDGIELADGVKFIFDEELVKENGSRGATYVPGTLAVAEAEGVPAVAAVPGKLYIHDTISDTTSTYGGSFTIGVIKFKIRDDITFETGRNPKFVISSTTAEYGNAESEASSAVQLSPLTKEITINISDEDLKDAAKKKVADHLKAKDYTYQKWENDVAKAIDDANKAIDAATTPEAIDEAVEDFKEAAAAIETLKQFKEKITADSYILGTETGVLEDVVEETDYLAADWTTIEGYVTAAKDAVNDSQDRSEDELISKIKDAQEDIDAVSTTSETIKEYQDMIVVDESKYVEEALDETVGDHDDDDLTPDQIIGAVAKAIDDAKKAIADKAILTGTTEDDLKDIVDAFKAGTTPYEAVKDELLTKVRKEYTDKVDAFITTGGYNDTDGAAPDNSFPALTETNYTDDNLVHIGMYMEIAKNRIDNDTSEEEMKKAYNWAIEKIAAVPTKSEASDKAFDKIMTEDNAFWGIEEIVDAVSYDPNNIAKVNLDKEALYEAAIEEAKKNDPDSYTYVVGEGDAATTVTIDLTKKENLITLIEVINNLGIKVRGDFNVSNELDTLDPAQTMAYVCNHPVGCAVKAQGIVNADLHKAGDGVLTVFDVVEIQYELKQKILNN